eukprot:CAMPEP_0177585974 /NCGR_PEP_ID=MMETSP0419_2-20121207/4805_1 /TAXON_ID=582737 /ORGANISM="Tetraselmis sp., Strain GSL018" /LENGTH=142 /DNA_ID=CAMNT_0019075795 /DNA_START=95 /DNA_END=523 /DNA_ORIENTATION=-
MTVALKAGLASPPSSVKGSRSSLSIRSELSKPAAAPKPNQPKQPGGSKPASKPSETSSPSAVTVEYQRQQAKEMTKYFKRLKNAQTSANAPVFGFTTGNEINNGRWVMFGLLVGCLTEYATGVDFIDQLKLMGALFGLVDTD